MLKPKSIALYLQLMPIAGTNFFGYLFEYGYTSTMFPGHALAHFLVNLLALLLCNFVTVRLGHNVAVLLRNILALLQGNRHAALLGHLLAFLAGNLVASLLRHLLTTFLRDLVAGLLGHLMAAL